MKLAFKLILSIVSGAVLLLALDGYLSVQREVRLFKTEMQRDAALVGRTMTGPVQDVWRSSGEARALQLIEEVNSTEHGVLVRWVWLDASPGDAFRPAMSLKDLAPVLRGERVFITVPGRGAAGRLFTYVPVTVDSARPGALELSESLAPLESYTHETVLRTLVLTGALILVGGIAGILFGLGLVGHPLQRLIEKTKRIGSGDLSGPVHIPGHDELSELASATNLMCERLAANQERLRAETEARVLAIEQLRHADRLRTVGNLASGIAHEMGTPLNIISGRAELIASPGLPPEETAESAAIIRKQSERIATITRQLLDFARRPAPDRTVVDLYRHARKTIDLLLPMARGEGVELALSSGSSSALAPIDAGQIEQVLTNLVVNAIQATPPGGRVGVSLGRRFARPPAGQLGAAGEYVTIDVRDNGAGISEENKRRLFEPFFTTKSVGAGTGLGLSVAHGIMVEHGGWIDVESAPGEGSCFSIHLPGVLGGPADEPRNESPDTIETERSHEMPEKTESTGPAEGAPRILLAEDDNEMRRLVARALRKAGYRVTECLHGMELLGHLSSFFIPGKPETIDLVVTDIRMPGVSGLEVLAGLSDKEGAPPVILVTAFGSPETHEYAKKLRAVALFDKPFEIDALVAEVRRVVPFDAPRGTGPATPHV